MQFGSLEHAAHLIKQKQSELASARLLRGVMDGKDPAYSFGECVGESRGLQHALKIIDELLNPADPAAKEKKQNGK
jgi:hypothetical protein